MRPASVRLAYAGNDLVRSGSGVTPPGSWQATTPSDTSSRATDYDPRFDVGLAVERDVDGDEPRGGLKEHTGRRAVIVPADHAPGRVRRGRAQSGRLAARRG